MEEDLSVVLLVRLHTSNTWSPAGPICSVTKIKIVIYLEEKLLREKCTATLLMHCSSLAESWPNPELVIEMVFD